MCKGEKNSDSVRGGERETEILYHSIMLLRE
jgi:hypothetical protein